MLQDRTDGELTRLFEVTQAFVQSARQRPEIASINTGLRTTVPQFRVDLDTDKAQTLGVPVTDVYSALQTFLGGLYVNDFNRFGRTWRVLMQAEPQFRVRPDDISQFHVRGRDGDMIPLSTLVNVRPVSGPEVVYRYNRFRAAQLTGTNAPGYSSGQAAAALEQVARQVLPPGFGYEWTGTVFQQRRNEGTEPFIFGFAAVLVLLFLAALYESWSTPFAVVLAVPLGLLGALIAIGVRSYPYDLYTHCGIRDAYFDDRWWEADSPSQDDPAKGSSPYNGSVSGTMTLTSPTAARFDGPHKLTVTFHPLDGQPLPCA